MPELPDITIYIEALERRILNATLNEVRISSPFLLRTATPPIQSVRGRKVIALRRIGKRIAIGLNEELWLVLHLMIAGRLHWVSAPPIPSDTKPGRHYKFSAKNSLAIFEFSSGSLALTESGTKRRAALHLLQGESALDEVNPGGLEVMDCSDGQFAAVLKSENHTLKRALSDPRLFSGIGNAYSDEILHRAQLSPVLLTQKLSRAEVERLHRATQETLSWWIQRLRAEAGDGFPENVTAFRPEMAVHGKFEKPCPVCGTKVQRIRYAENETNYCPKCQTNEKLLADRSLSLLLKQDWPKTVQELEEMRSARIRI